MQNENSETLVIASIPENINSVELYIDRILKMYNIDDELYGNVLISVIEGANNAITHGNNCDVSKQVKIEHLLSENKKSITFIIADEGSGFDYNNLPDPTAPENIEDFGGRGVFLMKQLADVTIFQKQGSIVELTFKL